LALFVFNKDQALTLRVVGLVLSIAALALLGWEFYSTTLEMATISRVTWIVYGKQPGPFIWLAFSLGFLCGHLFWQQRGNE
jgi:hypothetical protein